MATVNTYRITRKGASHRRREDGKGFVAYSADPAIGSNQITLTEEQVRSGKYNHLGLVQVTQTELTEQARLKAAEKAGEVLKDTVSPPIQSEVTDGSRTADGNQTQGQDQLTTGEENENVGDGTTKTPEQLAAEAKDVKLDDFIKRADTASNAGDFKKVRDELVEAKLLGDAEDAVPAKKKEVLAALRAAKSDASAE